MTMSTAPGWDLCFVVNLHYSENWHLHYLDFYIYIYIYLLLHGHIPRSVGIIQCTEWTSATMPISWSNAVYRVDISHNAPKHRPTVFSLMLSLSKGNCALSV